MKEFTDNVAGVTGARTDVSKPDQVDDLIEQRMQDILTGTNPAVVPSPELMQKLNALRPR